MIHLYHLLYDSIHDMNIFKVFGSLCYASTLQSHRTKLYPRARKSTFLGYKLDFKGHVLFYLHSSKGIARPLSELMSCNKL
jgi:hypothetical protein